MSATGVVGSRLVPAVRGAGCDGRALVRDADGHEPTEGVAAFEGDLLQPAPSDGALDGAATPLERAGGTA